MQLLPTLFGAVRKATDCQSTLTAALGHICERTNWDYGEAWIPSKDGTILQHSSTFYINTHKSKDCITALEQFWHCSHALILTPGVGLPGRVWLSQQPEWICDVSQQL